VHLLGGRLRLLLLRLLLLLLRLRRRRFVVKVVGLCFWG
jgi:hypothetical protein